MAPSPPQGHAACVCQNCKIRKKRCDKILPCCSYCKDRDLKCSYEDSRLVPNRRVVRHSPRAAPEALVSQNIDHRFNTEVGRILESIGVSFDELGHKYFAEFHPGFPIMSPRLFYEAAVAQSPPSAEFSALTLAMCLVLLKPASDEIYASLKSLYSELQILTVASIALVRTSLLIAAYEYARGWIGTAFVSIGSCSRVAAVTCWNGDPKATSHIIDCTEEKLFQCIKILELIIVSEIPSGFRPKDAVSCRDFPIPSLLPVQENPGDVGPFGCLIQAAALLARTLDLVSPSLSTGSGPPSYTPLDNDIHDFLMWLVADDGPDQAHHSGAAMVVGVRSVFLLHRHLISRSTIPEVAEMLPKSYASIASAISMMSDCAHDHENRGYSHALPFCCASNLQDASKFAKELPGGLPNADKITKNLHTLEKAFCRKWRP